MTMRPLGEQISRMLAERGVDTIFGIPGVHNIELYRGLDHSGLTHVLARHEQGAGFMADGYARATGRPGVAYVITGPGLTNIMTPMGQAWSDSVPLLVISSCLNRADLGMGRGRLHEMRDQQAAAACVCDWSLTAMDAASAYGLIDRALAEFQTLRPRSKHIQIPMDVLAAMAPPPPAQAALTAPEAIGVEAALQPILKAAPSALSVRRRGLPCRRGGAAGAGQAGGRLLHNLRRARHHRARRVAELRRVPGEARQRAGLRLCRSGGGSGHRTFRDRPLARRAGP